MDKIIKELQENIHQILEVMSDELLIADGEGRVLVVSSSFEEFYGLSKESVVGRTVYELETEGFFKPSIIAQVLSKKEKLTLPQKSNMGRHILVTATPIFGKNKSIKLVVSYARDITEVMRYYGERFFSSNFGVISTQVMIASILGPYVAGKMYTETGMYNASFYMIGAFSLLSLVVIAIFVAIVKAKNK